ncbi:MAG: hypothetical protein H6601_08540 [Flavobacteriales bacterium]|nr:hypothetical protein [Flavobacteriales bacterium]
MKKLVYIIVAIALVSCGEQKSTVTDVIGSGHFRGNEIGDKREKVEKHAAVDNIVNRTEASINCELTVDDIELLARYDFDQEALYSIQADMFFPDTSEMNAFQGQLIKHYNAKYGEVNMDGGFLVWQEEGKVEFTLADESIEFGQPKLSLTIYNFDY